MDILLGVLAALIAVTGIGLLLIATAYILARLFRLSQNSIGWCGIILVRMILPSLSGILALFLSPFFVGVSPSLGRAYVITLILIVALHLITVLDMSFVFTQTILKFIGVMTGYIRSFLRLSDDWKEWHYRRRRN